MGAAQQQAIALLADGEVLVRNLVRRILEEAGFLVLSAADAQEALKLSVTFKDRLDILVMDVEVPGMDGVALAELIANDQRDMQVLLMSAGTTRSIPGHIPFIAKPFPPAELVATVKHLLETGKKNAA